jgi:hypothetical protein
MSKVITSPVKRFPGTVTLSDPLTFPQALAWEKALAAARETGGNSMLAVNAALLPGVFACIEKWDIVGVSNPPQADTFPATPGKPVAELIGWLVGEVARLFDDAEGGDPLA